MEINIINKFNQMTYIFVSENRMEIVLAFIISITLWSALSFGTLVTKADEKDSTHRTVSRMRLVVSTIALGCVGLMLWSYVNYGIFKDGSIIIGIICAVFLGKLIRIFYGRMIYPYFNNLWNRFAVKQTSDEISDIRDEIGNLKSENYDPLKYFKNGKIFKGLDHNYKPVYLSFDEWKGANQSITGATQFGKGVMIGMELHQAIIEGVGVIFIDPKPDKHAYAIMKEACREAGREFKELDLTATNKTPAYELFSCGTDSQRLERFYRLCDIDVGGGTDADFYKARERNDIQEILYDTGFKSIDKIMQIIKQKQIRANGRNVPLESVMNALTEVSRQHGVCNVGEGFNLGEAVRQNSVIHIRASVTDKTVNKISKVLLDDLMTIIFNTSPENGGTRKHHQFITIDELRFLVTQMVADGMATIVGFDAHMSVAYQSIDDTRNITDKRIDKEALQTSISTNTATKVALLSKDFKTAEYYSELSGTIVKKIEDRHEIEQTSVGSDRLTGSKSIVLKEEQLVSPNIFMTLPKRVGYLFTANSLAQIIKLCWVAVDIRKAENQPIRWANGEVRPDSIYDRYRKRMANAEEMRNKKTASASVSNKAAKDKPKRGTTPDEMKKRIEQIRTARK